MDEIKYAELKEAVRSFTSSLESYANDSATVSKTILEAIIESDAYKNMKSK